MADDTDTKTVVDMALSAATTVAFVFGPVGVGIAAAIAVGKFLFDMFYQTTGVSDPMAQAPDKADLQNGLDKLRAQLDDDMFNYFTKTFQVNLFSASDTLNNAIRNAGSAPKAGLCLPGPTAVWINGRPDDLWKPLVDNPGLFAPALDWVETNPSDKFGTAPLYALTVSLNLLYLKTALVWEVNENLRYYEKLKASYQDEMDTYGTLHQSWKLAGADPKTEPVKPTTPEPEPPTGGDNAVGSEVRVGTVITDVGSHLGKVSSKWAVAVRDLLNDTDAAGNPIGPIAYMDKVIAAHAQGMVTKNAAIAARQALVTDSQITIAGIAFPAWVDSATGMFGMTVPAVASSNAFRVLQEGIYKEGLAGNMDNVLMAATKLEKLTGDDITKLKATVDKWRATLKMYRDSLASLDDGPVYPNSVI